MNRFVRSMGVNQVPSMCTASGAPGRWMSSELANESFRTQYGRYAEKPETSNKEKSPARNADIGFPRLETKALVRYNQRSSKAMVPYT